MFLRSDVNKDLVIGYPLVDESNRSYFMSDEVFRPKAVCSEKGKYLGNTLPLSIGNHSHYDLAELSKCGPSETVHLLGVTCLYLAVCDEGTLGIMVLNVPQEDMTDDMIKFDHIVDVGNSRVSVKFEAVWHPLSETLAVMSARVIEVSEHVPFGLKVVGMDLSYLIDIA